MDDWESDEYLYQINGSMATETLDNKISGQLHWDPSLRVKTK